MVQYRGVHNKTLPENRFIGNNYYDINGKQISERGYTRIMKLSKSTGEYIINMTRGYIEG